MCAMIAAFSSIYFSMFDNSCCYHDRSCNSDPIRLKLRVQFFMIVCRLTLLVTSLLVAAYSSPIRKCVFGSNETNCNPKKRLMAFQDIPFHDVISHMHLPIADLVQLRSVSSLFQDGINLFAPFLDSNHALRKQIEVSCLPRTSDLLMKRVFQGTKAYRLFDLISNTTRCLNAVSEFCYAFSNHMVSPISLDISNSFLHSNPINIAFFRSCPTKVKVRNRLTISSLKVLPTFKIRSLTISRLNLSSHFGIAAIGAISKMRLGADLNRNLRKFLSVIKSSSIKNLEFHESALTDYQVAAVAGLMPQLTSFRISFVPLTQTTLDIIASGLSKGRMEKLTLAYCNIGTLNTSTLTSAIAQSSFLKYLDLEGNSLESAFVDSIGSIISNLENLNLYCNKIGDAGARMIAEVLPRSNLRTLSVEDNFIEIEGLMVLSRALSLSKLTVLNVGFNRLNDVALITLMTNLPPTLRTLSLSNCGINSISILFIALRLPFTNIIDLDLSFNTINDDGIKLLSTVLPSTHLNELNIEDNDVTTLGAAYLANGLVESRIHTLRAGGNNLRNLGVVFLGLAAAQTRQPFRLLSVCDNNVAEFVAHQLTRIMPHVIDV